MTHLTKEQNLNRERFESLADIPEDTLRALVRRAHRVTIILDEDTGERTVEFELHQPILHDRRRRR